MPDEVVQTPFGKFFVDPEDCIGGTLKAGTLWDGPGFLEVLAKEHAQLGTPGVTILDVGANFGSFTVWCAHHGAWRVIAVEPLPETQRYLRGTLDQNQATCAASVIRLDLAAYDRVCDMESLDFSRRNIGGASVVPIGDGDELSPGAVGPLPAAPLDDFAWMFGDRVSFVKVDAQGCDAAVLHGLEHTLRRDHPAIVFEWEERLAPPHGYTLEGTFRWLNTLGYRVKQWPSHPSNYVGIWHG